MIKVSIFCFLSAIVFSLSLHAQNDTSTLSGTNVHKHSRLRISIITGTPGLDPMESFGHSCIRVVDSDNVTGGNDLIYNYGFYEEFTKGVYAQWATGRMNCFLETLTYNQVIEQFTQEGRCLTEQVLNLTEYQKYRIDSFLKDNKKNEKRYYLYDSFYDNCTTRIRDLLVKILGPGFVPGQVITNKSHVTFRDASINYYCPRQHKYWVGLGLNLLFGSRTDRVMTNNDALFDPWYLTAEIDGATIDGKKLCSEKVQLTPDATPWSAAGNEPLIWSIVIALITVISLSISRLKVAGRVVSLLLLLATGVIGCYLVYFWINDCDPGWKENYNLLWALPTNLIVPFLNPALKRKYSVAAICLLCACFLVHALRIQVFALAELTPAWFALLWVYATIYRRSSNKA